MTITTTDPKGIYNAAKVAGLTITTLRNIVGNDWGVEISETGANKDTVLAFCRALIDFDPAAVILAGKTRVDAWQLSLYHPAPHPTSGPNALVRAGVAYLTRTVR